MCLEQSFNIHFQKETILDVRDKFVEIKLKFPSDLTIVDLRSWVVNQLNKKGEPLRWAITSIQTPINNGLDSDIKIEAILITD